jgi:RNA polymerase sigma factor (sigma-70 family)
MDEKEFLAQQFEAKRGHLRAVAYRMLGSLSEAEDAVQDSWLHITRAETAAIENLEGWLTTVVARVCLDMLRARRSRREELAGAGPSEPTPSDRPANDTRSANDPEQEILLADSVGLALLVVLETLAPVERLSFVLHDLFAMPFEQIAPIVGRSPAAARQLASRARRRVQGNETVFSATEIARQRPVVEAFLAASRLGDFEALVRVLHPDVVLRTDDGAEGTREVRGARNVAGQAVNNGGRGRFAQVALVDGGVGVVVAPRGRLMLALAFTVVDGRITAIDVITTQARLAKLQLAVVALPEPPSA